MNGKKEQGEVERDHYIGKEVVCRFGWSCVLVLWHRFSIGCCDTQGIKEVLKKYILVLFIKRSWGQNVGVNLQGGGKLVIK